MRIVYDIPNVFSCVEKAMPFPVGQLSNDIERIVLEPFWKINRAFFAWSLAEAGLEHGQKGFNCVVDVRLVLDEGSHRERIVNPSPDVIVPILVKARK
jgi:hypothetical protein